MSQRRHSGPLPTPEDVEKLLPAALDAAESQYQSQKYPYLNDALDRLSSSSVEWLHQGMNPSEVLVDAIQDERTLLDRHNRLQAKVLHRQEVVNDLSEELFNFPLRYLCTDWKDFLLPAGFPKLIFQIDDHPDIVITPTTPICNNTYIWALCINAYLRRHDDTRRALYTMRSRQ